MKTLYLHIGSPKTGTTSIQYFCFDNREVLEKKGFCYPSFPYRYPYNNSRLNPTVRNGLFCQAMYMNEDGVRDKEKETEIFDDAMQRIRGVFETYDNVIISDEDIWSSAGRRRKGFWKDVHEKAQEGGFTVKVIAYVRKQDELIESWWNQTIKHSASRSNTMTWEEYLEVYPQYINLEYYALLKAAADMFGVENIIVRRFNSKYFVDGSLLADFLDILGLKLTDEFLVDDQSVKNTRMTENLCEIKRIINCMPEVEIEERWRYERLLRDISQEPGAGPPRRMFSAEEASAFMERYESSNQKLYEMFFADGKPLFEEKGGDPPEKWKKDNPDMLTDLVRFIVICDLNRKKELRRMVYNSRFIRRLKRKIRLFVQKIRNKIGGNEEAA